MKLAVLTLFALVSFAAAPAVYADSTSLSVPAAGLTQLVAPESTATDPVLSTTAQAPNSVAPTTITDLFDPTADPMSSTLDVVDMSSSYLTLTPLTHVSSYTYPSRALNADMTARLYKVAAFTFGAGLILALGLLEAAQDFDLARLVGVFRNEEVI